MLPNAVKRVINFIAPSLLNSLGEYYYADAVLEKAIADAGDAGTPTINVKIRYQSEESGIIKLNLVDGRIGTTISAKDAMVTFGKINADELKYAIGATLNVAKGNIPENVEFAYSLNDSKKKQIKYYNSFE